MKQVLKKRDDVVFFLKMYPLVSLHPEAYKKSQTIVCERQVSNERALQLLEDAYAKKELPEPSCKTDVIDKNIALAQRLGITGTPTLIFNNGKVISGAVKADQLITLIDQNSEGGPGNKQQ